MSIRAAALYDVHGNLPALEAVVAELTDVDHVVVGGDFLWGPMPAETLALLRSIGIPTSYVHGNTERDIYTRAAGGYADANNWLADQLEAELDWLRGLPPTVTLDIEGSGPVLFCHGSPRNDEETITSATPPERLREMCAGVDERVVVCGHTHAQFDVTIEDLRVVNAGSVGLPFADAPGAYWAVLGSDVEHRRTSYDVAAAADAFRRSGMPGVDALADQILAPPPTQLAAELFT